MKKVFTFIVALSLVISGCSTEHTKALLISPSGEEMIVSSVNEDNIVTIDLYNAENIKLGSLNTHASNLMKWSVGWDTNEDIIILNSSDIGTYAWTFNENEFQSIDPSTQLKKRAEDLFQQKYQ